MVYYHPFIIYTFYYSNLMFYEHLVFTLFLFPLSAEANYPMVNTPLLISPQGVKNTRF